MKIQINTEAELDIDAIADELNSHIENKIEEYIDCALDNYDFRDIVRDEINDMDLSYEISSVIDGRDDIVLNNEIVELEDSFKERIEAIETVFSSISSVIPNKALDASLKANEELSKAYNELVEKCKHFIGVTEPKENTESSDQ
jgi:predicted RND superfamily exporter protein